MSWSRKVKFRYPNASGFLHVPTSFWEQKENFTHPKPRRKPGLIRTILPELHTLIPVSILQWKWLCKAQGKSQAIIGAFSRGILFFPSSLFILSFLLPSLPFFNSYTMWFCFLLKSSLSSLLLLCFSYQCQGTYALFYTLVRKQEKLLPVHNWNVILNKSIN